MNAEWLESYSGETTAQLLAMAPRYNVASLVLAFEEAVANRLLDYIRAHQDQVPS